MCKSQMIEEMAKALYANDDKYGKYPWGIATDRIKEMFRSDAKAAAKSVEKYFAHDTNAASKPQVTDTKYLIWDSKHKAWWRKGGGGYTSERSEAGKFSADYIATFNEVTDCRNLSPYPASQRTGAGDGS